LRLRCTLAIDRGRRDRNYIDNYLRQASAVVAN